MPKKMSEKISKKGSFVIEGKDPVVNLFTEVVTEVAELSGKIEGLITRIGDLDAHVINQHSSMFSELGEVSKKMTQIEEQVEEIGNRVRQGRMQILLEILKTPKGWIIVLVILLIVSALIFGLSEVAEVLKGFSFKGEV